MDIETYLHERRETLGESTRAVRDFRVFDFSYVPEKPIMRDEAKTIIDALLRYERTGVPTNLAVIGPRGSGKTMMMRYLERLLSRTGRLRLCYCSIRENPTSFRAVAHILGESARGRSLGELYDRFREKMTERTVLILDEADLWSVKDRSRDLLYHVSRSDRAYMTILLSNAPRLLDELDPSVRSSLQAETLFFRNYDAGQIGDILRDRAQRGLDSWDEADVGQSAALTAQFGGSDVRVAIKTLFYVATKQGTVEQAFERARRDIFVDVLASLGDKELLTLWAASQCQTGFAKTVYRGFRTLCEQHHELPISYAHWYVMLGQLQAMGAVLLVAAKTGRCYTNRIDLLLDTRILEMITKRRFGI